MAGMEDLARRGRALQPGRVKVEREEGMGGQGAGAEGGEDMLQSGHHRASACGHAVSQGREKNIDRRKAARDFVSRERAVRDDWNSAYGRANCPGMRADIE